MANTIPNNPLLTTAQITKAGLNILTQEMYDITPYCLVVVTLKDDTTQEMIVRMHPRDVHEIGTDLKKSGGITISNEEGAILVMASEVKHVKVMKVTKEV